MTYDRRRRTECNHPFPRTRDPPSSGSAPRGPWKPAQRPLRAHLQQRRRHPLRGTTGGVEYSVRSARITDIDRLVALLGDRLGGRTSDDRLDAADLLRQLVYLPHASVLVAERRRELVGGAVLAIRPSVRAGGYVGTLDVLAVGPGSDTGPVTEALLAEVLRSAGNKGCATVEAARPEDPDELARWERRGFVDAGPIIERAVAPAGAGRRAR